MLVAAHEPRGSGPELASFRPRNDGRRYDVSTNLSNVRRAGTLDIHERDAKCLVRLSGAVSVAD